MLVGRGLRLFLLAAAILWLLYLVRANPNALPDGAVATSVIAGRLEAGGALPEQDDRLRTVLPILRNMLGPLIGAVAIMTVLSELGVDIGPLLGKALQDDPEFGPLLIETVKLKGVEQFGEYGMTRGFGMKLKPTGLQSMIRCRAFAMLKDAFEQNGIEFATMAGAGPGKPRPAHQPEDVRPTEPDI